MHFLSLCIRNILFWQPKVLVLILQEVLLPVGSNDNDINNNNNNNNNNSNNNNNNNNNNEIMMIITYCPH